MKNEIREAVTPPETIEALLRVAGSNVILVGGQSLAVWVEYYGVYVPESIPAISADVDFLTRSPADKGAVQRFAAAMGGQPLYPNIRSLTALVGQAVREVGNDEYLNVDVIWDVLGVPARDVMARAVQFEVDDICYRVMHPMHVLASRIQNLYQVPEKQNEKGVSQLRLAIDVTREFLRAESRREAQAQGSEVRSPIQGLISEIEKLALRGPGRKIAARYGVNIADAIDPSLVSSRQFWEVKWPILQLAMTPNYAASFAPPSAVPERASQA